MKIRLLARTVFFLTLLAPAALHAQQRPAPNPAPPKGGQLPTQPGPHHKGHESCLKQAGVSQSVIQKHHQIVESARQQVEAVCSNSSLTDQQKREQIKQIHQNEHQQTTALLTPQQQSAVEQCRRAHEHPHVGGGGGPCEGIH